MMKLSKVTKILILLVIISVVLCIMAIPKKVNTIGGREQHYKGSYNVIQKDLKSNKEVGYAISDGLVNPFYKDQYYFEMKFDFKYKTDEIKYSKLAKDKQASMISMKNFKEDSKFNVELYNYENDKKIETINLYPILKDKLKGLYFLDGFSDAYLSKEGKDLVFNLPINKETVVSKYLKFKDKKDKVIAKINLKTKELVFDRYKFKNNCTNIMCNRKSFESLGEILENSKEIGDKAISDYQLYKNEKYNESPFYIYDYQGYRGDNSSISLITSLSGFYKNEYLNSKYFKLFPNLKHYIEKGAKENKLLVFYYKEKNTELEKEILKINKYDY